jgi:hypothetical protein
MNKQEKYQGKVDPVKRMKQYENMWNKNEKRKKKIFKAPPKKDESQKYDKEKGIVRNIYGDIIQNDEEYYSKIKMAKMRMLVQPIKHYYKTLD